MWSHHRLLSSESASRTFSHFSMSSTSHHRRRSSLVGTSDSFASSTSLRTPSLGLSASNSFVNSTTAAAACRSYTESTGRITRTTNDVKSTCCLLDRLLQSRFPTNLPTEYTFEYPSKLNCITAHETFEQQHDWPLSLRQLQQTWRLNYQEAAIYLQEGANNEKHAQHPANHMQMHFYHLVHHPIYKFLDICSAIALICVTAIENPGSSLPQLSHNVSESTNRSANRKWSQFLFVQFEIINHRWMRIQCRLSVELGILILITILIWLKYKWMGASCFFAHRRSCLKAFSLLAMLGEIALMYFRQKVHIRPWRALRILFLIDCSQFDQTRRSFRHFLTSLPNACHVLVAMLLLLINFALIGHFLFYDSPVRALQNRSMYVD